MTLTSELQALSRIQLRNKRVEATYKGESGYFTEKKISWKTGAISGVFRYNVSSNGYVRTSVSQINMVNNKLVCLTKIS